MEFSTITLVIFVNFLDSIRGMDLNLPPDDAPEDEWEHLEMGHSSNPDTTIPDHTYRSQLDKLELELSSMKNDRNILMTDANYHDTKSRNFQTAERYIGIIENAMAKKKEQIRNLKISMDINPGPRESQAGPSSSGATSSSSTCPLSLDILKNQMKDIENQLEPRLNALRERKAVGASRLILKSEIEGLLATQKRKKKEIIREELKMQLGKDVEPEGVEYVYMEQERQQTRIELERKRNKLIEQLNRMPNEKGHVRGNTRSKIKRDLESIERLLNEKKD